MYTLKDLQDKNLKELKEIGWRLNVLPEGDRRVRQNWINALAGKNPPLLELVEDSPPVEVEPVAEAIEVQAQEPIESKFGRIVYPKPAAKPIAQTAINETIPDVEPRPASAAVHHSHIPTSQPDADSRSDEAERLGSQAGDRVLALARTSEEYKGRALLDRRDELAASPGVENFTECDQPPGRGDGKRRLMTEPELSQSAIGSAAENLPRSESDQNPILTGIRLSDKFLARYSPPQPENIHYQCDADGQLSLLDFEVETVNEPPDPEDYHSMFAFWAAYDAWVDENGEDNDVREEDRPLEISLDSMCEWAPCPPEWYEPTAESSSTCNFSIPTFDAWCDHAARQNDGDEPPDIGNYAKLPGPKPPKFPPRAIDYTAKHSPNTEQQLYCITYCIAAADSSQPARSPPGGDAL